MNLDDKLTGFFGEQGSNPNARVRDMFDAVSFSEAIHDTGLKWVNGAQIFRRVINMGALPNNTTSTVPHNIPDYANQIIIKCWGGAVNLSSLAFFPLPFVVNPITESVTLGLNATNAFIITDFDYSGYSAFAVAEWCAA